MEIKRMKLADLVPAPYHPRKEQKPGDANYEAVKKSILEFGYVDPIIWNRRTGNIVGGHQRWAVLLSMGIDEDDISIVDLPPAKEKMLNVALNKIGSDPEQLTSRRPRPGFLRRQRDHDDGRRADKPDRLSDGARSKVLRCNC